MKNINELPIITSVLHSGQLMFYLNEKHSVAVPSGARHLSAIESSVKSLHSQILTL